jgi:hypothetical protein
MKRLSFILFVILSILGAACGSKNQRLPEAVGGQGEVLVVMEKGHWEGEPGALVRSLLERPIARLPQKEAMFKVAHTTPDAFGSLLITHHNVLHSMIGASVDTNTVMLRRDVHARGQLLAAISAKDPVTWMDLMKNSGENLVDRFEDHQRQRIMSRLSTQQDKAMVGTLKNAHSLTMDVPAGFRVMKQDSNFVWLQRDRIMSGSGLEHNVIEGLLIYHYPYTSDSTFNAEQLVNVRDNVTRLHVPGPVDGSYMIVQRGFEQMDLMPESRMTELNGKFAYLMHGLFGMEGAKMGGPFVSLTTVDEERNRVVTVEGFVYAPQFDKREYIRELEAILFTLKFVPEERS